MNSSKGTAGAAHTTSHPCDVQAEYEWDDIRPSTAIISSVAVALNRRPRDLEPLYSAIDPDDLDALFSAAAGDALLVTFEYCGLDVTVTASGDVIVTA